MAEERALNKMEGMVIKMNVYFFYGIAALIVLAIYLIFNPERRYKKGDYFLPPFEIPPAEAGGFIDDTVNFEEIIGIIFYWAYKGYILIEETDNPITDIDRMYDSFIHSQDYILVKKSELSEDVETYEKELFNVIFPGQNDHCEIRNLKGNVYEEIEKVISDIKVEIDKKGYYVGNTRKNGESIKKMGIKMLQPFKKKKSKNVLKIFLIIFFAGLLIPYLLVAWILVTFGKILPVKNRKYREQFNVAKYFERFIKKVEPLEIESFMLQDKDYFYKTFPYAAAMGYAWEWTTKCYDYIEQPPEWYKGYGEFDKADFLEFTNKSYHILRKAFTSEVSDLVNFKSNTRGRR